jgi:hypothetical protein
MITSTSFRSRKITVGPYEMQASRGLWSRIVSTRFRFPNRSLKLYSCWICLAPWGPIIRGDNSRHYDNCSHYTGRPGGNPSPNVRPSPTGSTERASRPQVIEPIRRIIEAPRIQINAVNRGHLQVGRLPPYRPSQRNTERLAHVFIVYIKFYFSFLPIYILIFFLTILGCYLLKSYRRSGRWHPYYLYTRNILAALATWILLGVATKMATHRCLNAHCVLRCSPIQSFFMQN